MNQINESNAKLINFSLFFGYHLVRLKRCKVCSVDRPNKPLNKPLNTSAHKGQGLSGLAPSPFREEGTLQEARVQTA